MMRVLRTAVVGLVLVLVMTPASFAQDASDGFVPVDPSTEIVEQLPAAPMVMTAYALVWLVLLGYVWSLRRRQTRIELELASLRARVTQDVNSGARP